MKDLLIKTRSVFKIYFYLIPISIFFIGCKNQKKVDINLLKIEMTCDHNALDYGNALFRLLVKNETDSAISISCDTSQKHKGFCLLSKEFRSRWIKMEAAESFQTNYVDAGATKIIWIYISIDKLNNQFKGPHLVKDELEHVRRFLMSGNYQLFYYGDSALNNYQVTKVKSFNLVCPNYR